LITKAFKNDQRKDRPFMRFRRFLSGLLFGTGCALIFVGLLALILPLFSNSQLQLVLASFSAPSDHFAVNLMNRAVSFALLYSWRVLLLGIIMSCLGAWLMNYFTPKRSRRHPPVYQPAPVQHTPPLEPAPTMETEVPNPFAVTSYSTPLPVRQTVSSPLYHAAPILEKNRVEESISEASASAAYEPYIPQHLSAESIATETGTSSPSGNRIMRRSAYERPVQETSDKPEVSPVPESAFPPEETVSRATSSALTTPPVIQAPSPRIRSTMGQPGAARRNLTTRRP